MSNFHKWLESEVCEPSVLQKLIPPFLGVQPYRNLCPTKSSAVQSTCEWSPIIFLSREVPRNWSSHWFLGLCCSHWSCFRGAVFSLSYLSQKPLKNIFFKHDYLSSVPYLFFLFLKHENFSHRGLEKRHKIIFLNVDVRSVLGVFPINIAAVKFRRIYPARVNR